MTVSQEQFRRNTETQRSQAICNWMKTRDLAIRPEDCSATRNYIYADHSRLSFRTTLVAKERIHGRCGAIRDSYNAPIAKNVPANAVPAETSHRDTMAVATTIANQLQMARRDAVDKLEASKAVYLLEPTMPKRLVRRGCVLMILAVLHLRSEPRKEHESPRQSLPDLTPCGRPPRATVRCSAFPTDEYVF
jgi:hypothetical protein